MKYDPWGRDSLEPTVSKPEPDPAYNGPVFEPDAKEIRLTKSDAVRMTLVSMRLFQFRLAEWSERMTRDGFTISAEPDAGPGTMVWRARR